MKLFKITIQSREVNKLNASAWGEQFIEVTADSEAEAFMKAATLIGERRR